MYFENRNDHLLDKRFSTISYQLTSFHHEHEHQTPVYDATHTDETQLAKQMLGSVSSCPKISPPIPA